MRVVLAGFGPFPGAPFNPSARLATTLGRRQGPAFAQIERTVHLFPTVYAAVDRDLPKLLKVRPDVVLIFGLAAQRRALCIETRARNSRSVLFPDASRYRPQISVIARGKPSSRRGNAPFARLLGAARGRAVPIRLSRDAGRYLCNYAYWRALEATRDGRPLIAFVHIPTVRVAPQRRRGRRRAPPLAQVVATAEALLIALLAASRR